MAELEGDDRPVGDPVRGSDQFAAVVRIALAVIGMGLVITGSTAVFATTNDVGSAALLAAGVGLLFGAYAGPRIAHLKAGSLEFDLEKAEAVGAATAYASAANEAAKAGNDALAGQLHSRALETLRRLSPAARTYEEVRESMPFGLERTRRFDQLWGDFIKDTKTLELTPEEVRRLYREGSAGDRIQALAAMYAVPDLVQADLILDGATQMRTWNEHNYVLRVALKVLDRLTDEERERLHDALTSDRISASVQQDPPRQRLWREILELLENEGDKAAKE